MLCHSLFFNSSYSYTRDKILCDITKIFFQSFFSIGSKKKEKMDWVEPQSHQKFGKSHFVLEENINLIKSGIQAKSGLTNSSIERAGFAT